MDAKPSSGKTDGSTVNQSSTSRHAYINLWPSEFAVGSPLETVLSTELGPEASRGDVRGRHQ
jgi:hypothetical protein